MRKINVYIHIPFCKSKCFYCGFYSLCGQDRIWKLYFSQLKREILSFKNELKDYQVNTIYFGGGTPNLVEGKYLKEIIDLIKNNFETKLKKITVECNPEFITEEKLKIYKDAGVNRISIGIQSFDEKILEILGRKWNLEKIDINYFDFIKKKVEMVKSVGFENFNLDLIFGIPKQSLSSWQKSLMKAISLKPKHISCYSLEIDNNSILSRFITFRKIKKLSEDLDRRMYHLAGKILKENGYNHYEISNWAQKGFECQHNLDFWQGKDYIGFGAGASSYWQGKTWENYRLEKYLKNTKPKIKKLSKNEQIYSDIMKNLRLVKVGLNIDSFKQKFSGNIWKNFEAKFQKLEESNMINLKNDRVILTKKGLDCQSKILEFLL